MSTLPQIILLFGITYLVNQFVLPTMFTKLIGFHEKYNSKNIHRQPILFVRENKEKLIRGFRIFYWVSGALMAYGILIGE